MVKRTRRKSMRKHTRKRVSRRKTSRKKSRHGVKRKMRSTKKHLNRYSKNKFQRGGAPELYYKKNNVNFDRATGVLTADGSKFGRWNFRLFPGSFTVEYSKRRAEKGVPAISIRQDERPRSLAGSYHYKSKITILFDGDTAAEDEQKLYVELVGFSVSRDEHKFLNLAKKYRWEEVEVALSVNPGLVNVQTDGRWSALLQAVNQGNAALKMGSKGGDIAATAKKAMEMLVRYGADPNLANTSAKGTPISLAQSEEIKTHLRLAHEQQRATRAAPAEAAARAKQAHDQSRSLLTSVSSAQGAAVASAPLAADLGPQVGRHGVQLLGQVEGELRHAGLGQPVLERAEGVRLVGAAGRAPDGDHDGAAVASAPLAAEVGEAQGGQARRPTSRLAARGFQTGSADLDRLLELGYSRQRCEAALGRAGGDMRAAAAMLADGSVAEESPPPSEPEPEPEPEVGKAQGAAVASAPLAAEVGKAQDAAQRMRTALARQRRLVEIYDTVRATTGDDVDLLLYNADTTGIPGNLNPKIPTLYGGSVMDDMRRYTGKTQMYVLPSQLNAAEHISKDVTPAEDEYFRNLNPSLPTWVNMYVADSTGGPRAQLAGDHAIAEFIVMNAETTLNHGKVSSGAAGKKGKPPINYVREILHKFPGKLDLKNGYLGVLDTAHWEETDFLGLEAAAGTIQLLVSKDLPVSGYNSNLKPAGETAEKKKVHLAYASAVPIGIYDNDRSKATHRVADIIMEAQYTAALKAAIHLGVDELFLLPLGGKAFQNPRENIIKNILKALKKFDLSDTPLSAPDAIKLLTYGPQSEETRIFKQILSRATF